MESKIKWQIGEPKEVDGYIVTLSDGTITLDCAKDGKWYINEENVIAWCPLSEIEPYTE